MLPRVLIVDDESSICISLSLALESDYDMAWETDHIKALERIQQESFDLILLDMVINHYINKIRQYRFIESNKKR